MYKKRIIILAIIVITILILGIFPGISSFFNKNIRAGFSSIHGENKPDTNIVLIHINSDDIENLGDWPLKRSYYALLIDNLNKLNVSKIGIEIFLSENISSQSIYNNVLNKSIENAGNVVLASIAEEIVEDEEGFSSSGLLLPQPSKFVENIKTGHINFIEDDGIIIPSQINSSTKNEFSFVSILSGKIFSEPIKVNFTSNWKKFQNYSLLEFFGMIENNDNKLNRFKDKIVLIGVSDPLISKTLNANFNSNLPGLGLHAFALSNLLNKENINYSLNNFSKYIFWLFALLLGFFVIKNKLNTLILIASVVLFYFLYVFFYIELNFSAFLIPLFILFLTNLAYGFGENKLLLDKTQIESEELKKDLYDKQEVLSKLKKELEETKNPAEGLLLKIDELENEVGRLKKEEIEDSEVFQSGDEIQNFEGIVFKSNKMLKITKLIEKVAPEKASILIMGESGSGKELVANAIHNLSDRKDKPFVAVNCAALPDNLLESELFGHVKGAFTDAIKDKIGRFEEANNGTLFLDEIGETSENFQVKLLRVLQTGDYQKVGSSETKHANVRIVAATNKNLHNLVKKGEFREDLYYRLNVINIELPSLSERSEDIEVLAEFFMKQEEPEMSFSKAVVLKLVENEWKGNVRELQSTVKRAVIFAKSDNRKIIKLKDLPENLAKFDKDDLENMILDSLRDKKFSHSSINETAKELGGLNRTVITENYRGFFFKVYSQSNFDLEKAILEIALSEEEEIIAKVKSKVKTYLTNIEKDLMKFENESFEVIKKKFSSKYKNLPQKYHVYLDSVIKQIMKK